MILKKKTSLISLILSFFLIFTAVFAVGSVTYAADEGGVSYKYQEYAWALSEVNYITDTSKTYVSETAGDEKIVFESKFHKYVNVNNIDEMFVNSAKEFYYDMPHAGSDNVTLTVDALKDYRQEQEEAEKEWANMSTSEKEDFLNRWYGYLTETQKNRIIEYGWRYLNNNTNYSEILETLINLLEDAVYIKHTSFFYEYGRYWELQTPTYMILYNPNISDDVYVINQATYNAQDSIKISDSKIEEAIIMGYQIKKVKNNINDIYDKISSIDNLNFSNDEIMNSEEVEKSTEISYSKDSFKTYIKLEGSRPYYSAIYPEVLKYNSDYTQVYKLTAYDMDQAPTKITVTAASWIKDSEGITHNLVSEQTLSGTPFIEQGFSSSGTVGNIPIFTFVYDTDEAKTGNIKVTKKVTGSTSSTTFNFSIKLSDDTINGEYGDVTFTNGEGTFSLTKDNSVDITGLPSGITYEIIEGENADFSVTDENAKGEVKEGVTSEVTFTNKYIQRGGFAIHKEVDGNAGEVGKNFNFRIELEDKTINGQYGDAVFENGVAIVSVKGVEATEHSYDYKKDSEFINITGLPVGTKYTVTEIDADNYEISYQEEEVGASYTSWTRFVDGNQITDSISELGNHRYNFKNTKDNPNGKLTLTKKVTGNAGDKNKAFDFTIYISTSTEELDNNKYEENDNNPGVEYSGVTFTPAGNYLVGHVSLKDGESKEIELPYDTLYAIKEDSGEYEAEISASENSAEEVRRMTKSDIPEDVTSYGLIDGDKNVTYVNNLDKFDNIVISKKLAGNDIDSSKEFEFDIEVSYDNVIGEMKPGFALTGTYGDVELTDGKGTFKLKTGQAVTVKDLPYGVNYKITEKDYSSEGYTSSSNMSEGKIGDDTPDVVEFTNTRDTFGNLVIKKTASGNTIEDKTYKFKVTIGDVDATYSGIDFKNGVAEVELKANEEKTISNIPNGTKYAVEELNTDGYIVTASNDAGTIKGNETSTTTINNHKDTYGAIEISKTTSGNTIDASKTYKVEINAEGLEDGTYSGVAFKDGKAVVGIKADEHKVIGNIPNGVKYSVKEIEADDFDVTYTNEAGTVVGNQTQNVTINNHRDTFGKLSIKKTVSGNTIEDRTFKFNVTLGTENATYSGVEFKDGKGTIELKGNEEKVIENIPNGLPYTIEEVGADDYEITQEHTVGNIKGDETIYAVINNKKDTFGNLSILKTVSGNTIEDRTFKFKVTLEGENATYSGVEFKNGVAEISLKANEEKTLENIPNGVKYTVEELETDGYEVTSSLEKGVIKGGETARTIVNNHKDTFGNLSIGKTASGNDVDRDAEYKFKVTLEGENATYSGVEFKDGVAEITLKAEETKVFENIPNGVIYSVEEIDSNGYVVTATNETGTIKGDTTAEVLFNNARDTFGAINIKKTVSGNDINEDAEYTFKIMAAGSGKVLWTIDDEPDNEPLNGTYSDVEFKDGVGYVTLKANEEKTIEGLPNGMSYIVSEEDTDCEVTYEAEGVNVAAYNDDDVRKEVLGIVTGNTTDKIVVNNNRDTYGTISVKKTVSGDNIDENATYKVVINAGELTGKYSDVEFAKGSATVELKANEEKVIEGIPNNTEYKIVETEAENYIVTYENEEGVVKGNETSSAVVNNHRDKDTIIEEPIETTPDIYQPVEEVTTTVDTTETPIATTPTKTGDNNNIMIYAFIAIAAGLTAAGVITNRVRAKKNN